MNALTIPSSVSIRVATMSDLPFMDALQKQHSKQLGYFPTKQFEGYIEGGHVLVAEEVASEDNAPAALLPATNNQQLTTPLGYVISRDPI